MSRYLDDLLNIDNAYFEGMVNQIYPPELQLNKVNTWDTEAPFLDLHLSNSNGFISSKIYDKLEDFDFDIVNFPFLDGDIPRRPSYRVCSPVNDFNTRNKCLTAKRLKQGYRYHKLRKAFFQSFIADTMNWLQNSMSSENHFYNKAYRNQNYMGT